ncbi:hypothetical protein [Hydrogenophaga sp.]|uniref:hypothetical protein n=1 Tax=Hydrogenophaga sp. TaxID=1904254 RepID=UPI00261AB688|nr:hypothetical protein [Hydrogenophaga sp.]MDM7950084.1 hypothetical protein [Hydrogenophaga sp.]
MNVICLDGRLRISLEEARLSIAAALPVEGGVDMYGALLPDGTPDWEGPLEVVHNPHARRGEAYLEADFPALLAELEIVPRMIRRPTWKDFGPGKPLAEYSITRVEFSKLAECYGLSVIVEAPEQASPAQSAAEPAPLAPSASDAPVVAETVAQRRARWLDMFEAEEKRAKRGALTRLAKSEGVDRANMRKDINRAQTARDTEKRAGPWASQLVQGGKRPR